MRDLVPIKIPPGVVRGETPLDAKGRWWDTNLVRWRNGVLEPVRGWEKLNTAPLAGGRIRKLDVWRNNASARFMLAATNSNIFQQSDGSFVDITPAGFNPGTQADLYTGFGVGEFGDEAFGTARSVGSPMASIVRPYWTTPSWGEDKLAVMSTDGKLYTYDVTTPNSPFTLVSGAPTGNAAVHVTPERHVMLIRAGSNPRRVAWASRETLTDWNFASITNTAGYLDLECKTPLVKGVQSRAGTLVFSSSDVFIMPYTGLPYIYGQQWLGNSQLIGADTIIEDNGNIAWWAADGFKMFDGGAIRTLDCPVWDYVMSRTDPNALRTFAHGSAMGMYPELWWFYPSTDSGLCDSYVMTNYEEGWWAIGKLQRSAMAPALADKYPYMAGEDGLVYRHETGWSGSTGEAREVYAESNAVTLGAGGQFMDLLQALPAGGSGYEAMQLRVYANRTPMGAEREFGPYRVRSDGYMDMRVSGRDLRLRYESIKDEDWSVSETRFDVVPGTRR